MAPARPMRGFTLVELMITVVVAAVLLMIAVPSFQHVIVSNKLTTAANGFVHAANVARTEAIKRNASTQLCSNAVGVNGADTLGSACGTDSGAVYVLINGAASQVLAGAVGLDDAVQISGNLAAVRYSGQGLGHAVGNTAPYTGQVVDICTDRIDTDNHRVITMTAGSILATTTVTGDCP